MIIQPNSKSLMIGASITDCERARPGRGEGLIKALEIGYVSLMDAYLTVRYPEYRIRVVSIGVKGITVHDL